MANPWFKFYGTEYLGDLKIRGLSGDERSSWITLLSLASQTKDGSIKFLTEESLLEMSGVREKIPVLQKFKDLEMISVSNGNVTVLNWEKRQYSESLNRVREFRKREGNENVTTYKNREEEIREDKKNTYGEFKKVRLTPEEYQKLIKSLGEKNSILLIGELDNYIASKGKRYASHYATILTWARRRVQQHVEKLPTKKIGSV